MDEPNRQTPKREDAADRAPRPDLTAEKSRAEQPGRQDAPNYDGRADGGRAIKSEDINSANDE